MNTETFQRDILPLQHKLYRYALSIVFEAELARDIVQEVLLKVWTKRDQLADILNKEAWCVRMTRNLAFDKLKAASRKNVSLETTDYLDWAADHRSDQPLEQQELLTQVQQSMDGLSEVQRDIFRLRDLQGYSNQEIADLLELNANQVKVNLFRARQKVKLKLEKWMNYEKR